MIQLFFKLVPLFLLATCATSPTGRKQVLILPETEMAQMGQTAFQDLKQKTPVERGSSVNQYVRCVSDAITQVSPRPGTVSQWEVVVFRDDTANAFALPGGKIGVHTGLLKVAETPAQLAAVLGHEVGHVLAKHGNERVSQQLLAQGGLAALDASMQDGKKKNVLLTAAGLGTQLGVLLPFSRTHESEADVIGLELMAKAGFDPAESVLLWQNMSRASGGSPPEFLSTHPNPSNRISNLKSRLAQVRPLYEAAKASGKIPQCRK